MDTTNLLQQKYTCYDTPTYKQQVGFLHGNTLILNCSANIQIKSVLMHTHTHRILTIQYSGFLSRETTFANCLKTDFNGEKLSRICGNPVHHTHFSLRKLSRIAAETRNLRVFSRERNRLYDNMNSTYTVLATHIHSGIYSHQ